MQHIDLYDEMSLELSSHEGAILEIEDETSLLANVDNLVNKAANIIRSDAQIDTGLHIKLKKRLPIGAGLGGGSADAAAVLHGLNHLYGLNYSLEKLQYLGIKIGADVPYCLTEGPAIVSGIGEQISRINFLKEHWLVLLKPRESLSTKEVFSLYDSVKNTKKLNLTQSAAALRENDFHSLNVHGGNSLEPAAICLLPKIEYMKSSLIKEGAVFSQMSGSGSAVGDSYRCPARACRIIRWYP